MNNKIEEDKILLEKLIVKIEKLKPIEFKKHMTVQQQLKDLKNNKNFEIPKYFETKDIDGNSILLTPQEYLENENLTQVWKSYEDLFILSNDLKPERKLNIKSRVILKEYLDGKRYRIYSNKFLQIKDIIKHLKSDPNFKYKKSNFVELVKLSENDEYVVKYTSKRVRKIEKIIKNKISHFVGDESFKSLKSWGKWLLHITPDFMKLDICKIITKYNLFKLSLYYAVNEFTLGDMKNIIMAITYSNKLSPETIHNFYKDLFITKLGRKLLVNHIDYSEIIGYLIVLNRFRNSLMHSERINTFLLKERWKQLNTYLNNNNTRLWFKKNTNEDFTIKTFINNYKYSEVDNELSIFDNLQIGYYVEVENIKDSNIRCIDLEIIKTLKWWFS